MSGDVDAEGAQILTDLDAVGNTTKAITKGIAIATAVLAATALFGSYTDAVQTQRRRRRQRRGRPAAARCRSSLDLRGRHPDHPGRRDHRRRGGVPVLRAWRSTRSPGRPAPSCSRCAASSARTPGSWTAPRRPEYGRVVDICTRDSLRELATPGLLAVFAPIAVGFGLGVGPLAGYLAGAIATGTPDGGLPGQLRWRLGQRQEDRRGRHTTAARAPTAARGDGHRRHRRRPVQGHRRPGDQPADQGDEPGRAADRAGRRRRSPWAPSASPAMRYGIAAVAFVIVLAAVAYSKSKDIAIGSDSDPDSAAAEQQHPVSI